MKYIYMKLVFSISFLKKGLNLVFRFINKYIDYSKMSLIFSFLENKNTFPLYPKKVEVNGVNIIWSLWLQGLDDCPKLVRSCIDSFKRIDNSKVITLSFDNLSNYISLPEIIISKYKSGIISHTAFSELIRLEVLSIYGGLWLDSTMFIPNKLKINYKNFVFFSPREKEKVEDFELFGLFPMFFLYSEERYQPIINIRNSLLSYWAENNHQIDYFLIDYLFRLEYRKNTSFRRDVDAIPVVGKNLHSLEVYYADSPVDQALNSFLTTDPLGIYKLNYKNQHREFINSECTLYHAIINNNLYHQ